MYDLYAYRISSAAEVRSCGSLCMLMNYIVSFFFIQNKNIEIEIQKKKKSSKKKIVQKMCIVIAASPYRYIYTQYLAIEDHARNKEQ